MTLVDLAENGELAELRLRVENGADVNSPDPDGRVVLHAALAEGHIEIVRFLLDRGADPHVVDARGNSVLHWAARANDRGILQLAHSLVKGSVDPVDLEGRTPLSWVAQGDDCVAIEWLLEHGADPNRSDSTGWAPLHFAAADGNVEAIRLLLRGGAKALLRMFPEKGEEYGHSASDLARHYARDRQEALQLLRDAEDAEDAELGARLQN